jgi:gamma-butyrobetaine dioxygenase
MARLPQFINSRSICPVCLPSGELAAFYCAYRAFAHLQQDPRFELCIQLRRADLVTFNNRRVLRGRTTFPEHSGGDCKAATSIGRPYQ